MIFNSLTFLFFLIPVVLLYWILPYKLRIALLFGGSLVFYGFWRWEFLPVMLFSSVVDYFIAIAIHRHRADRALGKKLLFGTLLINLGLLVYFKYLFFLSGNFNQILELTGTAFRFDLPAIILPLGISFYTFQTISYSIDVYRGHALPERDFLLYGSYVTFFPQLVAGPILRAGEVIEQLRTRPRFRMEFIPSGLKRIGYGLFLKVVLADNIAPMVDEIFLTGAHSFSAIDVWTAAFLFGFQIYFDFAGYSHIAIGCALLMGIRFPENFNFPYASRSFKVFWKRWHISLSSWIRDYLYLPLAGKKVRFDKVGSRGGLGENVEQVQPGNGRKTYALFLTWAIMGLWHGANWTFVVWGLYHSLAVYLERLAHSLRFLKPLQTPVIGWLITFPIAMLGWIPFRALNVHDTFVLFSKILTPAAYLCYTFRENTYLVAFLLTVFTTLAFLLDSYSERIKSWPGWLVFSLQTLKYTAISILVFVFLRPISQFIYFQF